MKWQCITQSYCIVLSVIHIYQYRHKLEMWPLPNVMAALPNIGGALCSTPQSLADAFVSDIAIFVLKRDVKLQLTNFG